MIKLIGLGILSGAFFSSTFILNEAMSLGGGHWLWSASLRYFFMLLFLTLIIVFKNGLGEIKQLVHLFLIQFKFWTTAGCIGFGCFYALACFSADFAPGWVIAATWQFTVVASLFIFMAFGKTFPKRVWFFSVLIFLGVLLVNLSRVDHVDIKILFLGGFPVLLAAFCYPFGNQLVWEATNGSHPKIPRIDSPLVKDSFNRVFLMTLGSIPLWICLIFLVRPPVPQTSQIFSTALVALFSGVCATSIFLFARGLAKNPGELAGVDATQASEVVFALIGGMLFLGTDPPGLASLAGLFMVLAGLVLFVVFQSKASS